MGIIIAIAEGKTIAKAIAEGTFVANAIVKDKNIANVQGQSNVKKKLSYLLN